MATSESTENDENLTETNRMARLSFSIDTKSDFQATSIGIKDHITREGIGKKIFYVIIGNDKSGSFEATRRYSEFNLLRKTLMSLWPGFYVPNIPSKQQVGNLEPSFIERRKKLLELFLKKVTSLEYIYECDIFQLFLREKQDFKSVVKSYSISDSKITTKIISKFPRFTNDMLLPDIDQTFLDNEAVFKGALDSLYSLIYQASSLVDAFDTYESDLIDYMVDLKDLSAAFTGKISENQNRDTFFNPYVIVLDWATAEVLDLEAICEAIETRKKYENTVNSLEKTLENAKKNLLKIQSGKKSLSQIFKKESKEDRELKAQSEIELLDKSLNDSRLCFKVITLRLAKREIPMFKTAKMETYKNIMKAFANASIQELTFLVQQAQSLKFFLDY